MTLLYITNFVTGKSPYSSINRRRNCQSKLHAYPENYEMLMFFSRRQIL